MDYEAESIRPRGRSKKSWKWGYRKRWSDRQICKEHDMDRRKCRKL